VIKRLNWNIRFCDVCANSLSHSAQYVELLWVEYHNFKLLNNFVTTPLLHPAEFGLLGW